MRLAGFPELGPEPLALLHRDVDLPAKVTDVADARRQRHLRADLDGPAGAELEGLGGHVLAGDRLDDPAGVGAPEADRRVGGGEVDERGVVLEVVPEPLEVGHAVGAAGDDPEDVLLEAHDREVGLEAARLGQDGRVDHAADRDVHLAHRDLLDGRQGARADDVEDGERGEVEDAGGLAHGEVLGVDDRAPPARVPLVGARRDTVLLDEGGVAVVPLRPLPAGDLEELGVVGALPLVHRGHAQVAVGQVLLGRVDDAVGLGERLERAGLRVLAGLLVGWRRLMSRLVAVDLGLAVDHPLGDGLADRGPFLDPDRGGGPEALDLGRLAQERHAVRRERDEAVDGVLLADLLVAEDLREELEGVLELRVEVVLGERELRRREGGLLVGRDRLRVVQDGPVGVRADLESDAVLALVHEDVHVADDRVLDRPGRLREDLDGAVVGHLVDDRGERDARAGHLGQERGPDAAGDDHVLGLDGAAARGHAPDAAVLDAHRGDLGVRERGQGTHLLRLLAGDGAEAERVADADLGRVEAADEDRTRR